MLDYDVSDLKDLAQGQTLLFVEPEDKLREQITLFLQKFLDRVYIASSGEEGLELYSKHHPDIILCEFTMPQNNSFSLIKEVRDLDKEILILSLSLSKESESLAYAISYEVFRYLTKPINVNELASAFSDAFHRIRDRNQKIPMQNLSQHQNAIAFELKDNKLSVVNQQFLNFFAVKDIPAFYKDYPIINTIFLEQKGFFSLRQGRELTSFIMHDSRNVYNTKLKDIKGINHHFILTIERNFSDNSVIFVLSDVTELNFLPLFDTPKGVIAKDTLPTNVYDSLLKIYKSGASVQFFNTYKGLPITHNATFNSIGLNKVGLTSTMQQAKAISLEDHVYIFSPLLPFAILCQSIEAMNFQSGRVILKIGNFVSTSPLMRKSIRLEPLEHVVTLLRHDSKLPMNATIKDISMKTVSLTTTNFMPTLEKDDVIQIDIVFSVNRQKTIINGFASLYKITKFKKHHEVVLLLALDTLNEKALTEYILKRQMELIREFKSRTKGQL